MNAWWQWWRTRPPAFVAPVPWVDFHCHLVPGVDDGPRTLADAAAMLECAARIGITHIVTTPHYSDRYAPDDAAIARALAGLQEQAQGAAAAVQIISGREVTLTDQHMRALKSSPALRIGAGPYALVELLEGLNRTAMVECCSDLLAAGVRPIIAHPERNFMVQNAPDIMAELRLRGALVQVNATSLNGVYGAAARRAAQQLLELQSVDMLSSDAHRASDFEAYASACELIARTVGAELVKELISSVPARILRNN